MGLDAWVELATLGLAVWAASRSVPRPPKLDWERLFKTALSVQLLVRGQAEPDEALPAKIRAALLFQPAGGPRPELKLLDPATAPVPVPPLPGERALVEALGRLSDPAARFNRMYLEDPLSEAALLEDPELLGPDYHPSRLAPGLDWEAVAAWSEPLQEALGRRLSAAVIVDLSGALGARMVEQTPALRRLAPELPEAPEALAEALLGALEAASDRLVLLGDGAAALRAVRALEAAPALRDRAGAVISLGGALGSGREDRAWFLENFQHELLDPELNRAIPYVSCASTPSTAPVDEALLEGWERQRFPVPPAPRSGRSALDPIDLGPLALDLVPEDALARALTLLLAFRLGDG